MDNYIERRKFLKSASIAGIAATFGCGMLRANEKSGDVLKIGLIGCGTRGCGAFANMYCADHNVKLVAVADLFPEKTEGVFDKIAAAFERNLKKYLNSRAIESSEIARAVNARDVRKFSGWNCVDELLKEDVDVVIEATPPVFRTPHFEKIVAAGKHAFLEKPCAVDVTQARKMRELSRLADAKGLCVVCGTQRRYNNGYREVIKRVHYGMIGEPLAAYAWWHEADYVGRKQLNHTEISVDEMEYQVRNWFSFIWTSGDHIVEQHVHNLDVIMWALGDQRFPKEVCGLGGRSTNLPSHNTATGSAISPSISIWGKDCVCRALAIKTPKPRTLQEKNLSAQRAL